MRPLTKAQRAALECTRDFGGDGSGWAEVELQLSSRLGWPDYLIAATSVRVFGALERKGLVTRSADGPSLTEAGRIVLGGIP